MLARVRTAAILGIDAYIVDVEVDVAAGLPAITTVGLAQSAVKEGRERVLSALGNTGFQVPPRRITINLAPADIKKQGSHFDLPIACGLLAAAEQLTPDKLDRYALVGELGLDGSLRPVPGVLSIAAALERAGVTGLIVPTANADEAAVVAELEVYGARTLGEVVAFLAGEFEIARSRPPLPPLLNARRPRCGDLADVQGQLHAKRALEVAAAGAHNILFVGPPGGGKTMLARRLPSILPRLTLPESIEVTRIHSVAGQLVPGSGLITERPFRAPHHTISDAGLVGGGAVPRPGEASLAHHGVLFLDELTEFRRNVLEVLRGPLEDGQVTIGRAARTLTFPARFVLAAAMNPCPCGHLGDPRRPCRCTPALVRRYRTRVSGPLLDRIDLHIEVPPVPARELLRRREPAGATSGEVRARVDIARERQARRFAASAELYANGHMGTRAVHRFVRPTDTSLALLRSAIARFGLSARAFHRVLKVARTIADLAGADRVESEHVAEAIQYRGLDRGEVEDAAGSP